MRWRKQIHFEKNSLEHPCIFAKYRMERNVDKVSLDTRLRCTFYNVTYENWTIRTNCQRNANEMESFSKKKRFWWISPSTCHLSQTDVLTLKCNVEIFRNSHQLPPKATTAMLRIIIAENTHLLIFALLPIGIVSWVFVFSFNPH